MSSVEGYVSKHDRAVLYFNGYCSARSLHHLAHLVPLDDKERETILQATDLIATVFLDHYKEVWGHAVPPKGHIRTTTQHTTTKRAGMVPDGTDTNEQLDSPRS